MKIQPRKPLGLLWPNLNGVTQVHRLVMDDVAKQGWFKESSLKYCFILRMDYIICFVLKDMTHRELMIPFPFFPEIWIKPKFLGVGCGNHISRVPQHFNGGFNSAINQICDLDKSPNFWISISSSIKRG